MELTIDRRPSDFFFPIDFKDFIYKKCEGKLDEAEWEDKVIYSQSIQGQATLHFKNGNIYQGEMKNGVLNGKGKLTLANETVYTGDFRENKITGSGKIQWRDGSVYEGEVLNGLRHGKGTFIGTNNEAKYTGEWKDGLRNGYGVLELRNGQIYEGQFFNGYKHGKGKIIYESKNTYDGEWQLDKKDGYGVMCWEEKKEKYYGYWKGSQQNGFGVHIWLESKGEGKFIKNRYEGNWLNGQRHGLGTQYYTDGSKYQGEWKNNLKDGFSIYVKETGEIIMAYFKADKFIRQELSIAQISEDKLKMELVTKQPKRQSVKKSKPTSPKSSMARVQFQTNNFLKSPEKARDHGKGSSNTNSVQSQNKRSPQAQKNGKGGIIGEETSSQLQSQTNFELNRYEIYSNPFNSIVDFCDFLLANNDNYIQQFQELKQTILRNNTCIKSLYKIYSSKCESSLGENACCMDLKSFWILLKDIKILDCNCTLAAINRLFHQGYKNTYQLEQNIEKQENQIQFAKQLHRSMSNEEYYNIDLLDLLKKIENAARFDFKLFNQQKEIFLNDNLSNQVYITKRTDLIDIHNPQTVVLPRHFIELLVRTCFIKNRGHENLSKFFEKMLESKFMTILDQSQVKQKTNNSTSQEQDETDHFHQKTKRGYDLINFELKQLFNKIRGNTRNKGFIYIDNTCQFKDVFRVLQNSKYISETQDKAIALHIIEKNFDPEQTIGYIDSLSKEEEIRMSSNQFDNNQKLKKGPTKLMKNKKLLPKFDKMKQSKIIEILEIEFIFFEFCDFILQFLYRKDRDLAHTKANEELRKKLLIHIENLEKGLENGLENGNKQDHQLLRQCRIPIVYPISQKDRDKEELAKLIIKKQQEDRIIQQILKEQQNEERERVDMQKEDTDINNLIKDEEEEEYEESDIENYDDYYLQNL